MYRRKFRRVWKAIKRRPVPEIKHYSRIIAGVTTPSENDDNGIYGLNAYVNAGTDFNPMMLLEMGKDIKQEISADGAPYAGNPDPDPSAAYVEGDQVFVKNWTIRVLLDLGNAVDGRVGNGHFKMMLFSYPDDITSPITEEMNSTWDLNANSSAMTCRNVWALSVDNAIANGSSRTEAANRAGFWPRVKLAENFKVLFRARKIWEWPRDFPRLNAATQWLRCINTKSDGSGTAFITQPQTQYVPLVIKVKINRKKHFIKILDKRDPATYRGHLFPRLFFGMWAPNFSGAIQSMFIPNGFETGNWGCYDTISFQDN